MVLQPPSAQSGAASAALVIGVPASLPLRPHFPGGTFKRGWLFMAEKEVVYLSVSDITGEIARFHDELYRLLDGRATLKEPNLGKPGKFTPHITMALREAGLDEVESYLKKHDVHAQGRICRVTLLERGRIVFEYDMERRRVMGREAALRRRNVCSGMP